MKVKYVDEQEHARAKLYAQFVKPGALVFNVGASIGTRTDLFASFGAKVIALEPQPEMARRLRSRFKNDPNVTVIEAAAGPEMGVVELMLCGDNPIPLATAEPAWIEAIEDNYCDNWPMESWSQKITAKQITLDSLIDRYGLPDFIKIDVDGYERPVLQGLSQKTPTLCFEVTLPYGDPAIDVVADVANLGYTEFNYLVQEWMKLILDDWVGPDCMMAVLRALPMSAFFVDVFAR